MFEWKTKFDGGHPMKVNMFQFQCLKESIKIFFNERESMLIQREQGETYFKLLKRLNALSRGAKSPASWHPRCQKVFEKSYSGRKFLPECI